MILNEIDSAYLGNIEVKEIYLGEILIYPQNFSFNISWNTANVQITAYTPVINDNDRPRINTFRTDNTYIVYMSAGYVLYDPNTYQNFTVWGDRTIDSKNVLIPLRKSLSAGIDLFTDSRLPTPYLIPTITNWVTSATINPNEIKYQYIVSNNSNSAQNVFIGLYSSTPPNESQLTNFTVTTTSGNVFVQWGDGVSEFINSNTPTNHDYYCSTYSLLTGFWTNIDPCT
jgi:hypothetical protein